MPFQKGNKIRLGKYHTEESNIKNRESHKNIIISDETRKKLSIARKGRKPMLGHHHSKESKKKISESNKGKKSHLWRGGISKAPYAFDFNKELKALIHGRDNYRCFCGAPSQVVHHIDYNKINSNLDNLIALCNSCHSKTNTDRKRWIIFFENRLF